MKIKIRKNKLWKFFLTKLFHTDEEMTVLTFGRTLYVSNKLKISGVSKDLMIHELTHSEQQKRSYLFAIIWWIRYLLSKKFRYRQELEAYQQQMYFIKTIVTDRNMLVKFRHRLAHDLSGQGYNYITSYEDAFKQLS